VGTGLCTHGPDPIPAALWARGGAEPVQGAALTQGPTTVLCNGDGVSGKRVQAVYAYVSGRQDRRSTYLASFRSWAAKVDTMFQTSAAESGGNRHLRWVTDSNCLLAVASVAVSSQAEANFGTMITELAAAGYNRTDRKYLVWFDSDPHNSSICGIGTVYPDDQPGQNLNDTLTGYARADFMCWDWSEPHELMHTLGAVQRTAPHATNGLHCTDEHDQMCYEDGVGVVMTYPCGDAHEVLFDCGHDDYFSVTPSPSSYLASHWNTANSGWLVNEPPDTTPPTVAEPGTAFVAGGQVATNARVRLAWPAATDRTGIAAYELQSKKGSGSWTDVALASATSTSVDLDLAVGAAYTFRLRARDGAGNTGAWTTTAARTLTLLQETATSITYSSGFKRVSLSGASGGYVRKSSLADSVSTFTFSGEDVAFVTTRGPGRGIATVRIDGGAWQSLDLYAATLVTKTAAWTVSLGAGTHKLEVRVSGGANASSSSARVDVDAFLYWK
jgi:hypothetical protein